MSSRRADCIRQLDVCDHMRSQTIPAALTAVVLGSQCRSVESLFLIATDVGLAGVDIAVLAAMTRLTRLEVCGDCTA